MIFSGFLDYFWKILAIFGRSGPVFEAISWEKVGRLVRNPNLFKLEVRIILVQVHKRINSIEL
jgi:hypothetical protein